MTKMSFHQTTKSDHVLLHAAYQPAAARSVRRATASCRGEREWKEVAQRCLLSLRRWILPSQVGNLHVRTEVQTRLWIVNTFPLSLCRTLREETAQRQIHDFRNLLARRKWPTERDVLHSNPPLPKCWARFARRSRGPRRKLITASLRLMKYRPNTRTAVCSVTQRCALQQSTHRLLSAQMKLNEKRAADAAQRVAENINLDDSTSGEKRHVQFRGGTRSLPHYRESPGSPGRCRRHGSTR